jgi:hypothetical protein
MNTVSIKLNSYCHSSTVKVTITQLEAMTACMRVWNFTPMDNMGGQIRQYVSIMDITKLRLDHDQHLEVKVSDRFPRVDTMWYSVGSVSKVKALQ